MTKIKKHIEIVSSSKSSLSSMSKRSRDSVLAVLSKHYTDVEITLVDNLPDLNALVDRKPDLVFLGMKYIPLDPAKGFHDVNKIWISQYLDEHNIAYTGSTQKAHELETDKPTAKQYAIEAGLKTSPYYVAVQNQPLVESDIVLTYPLFIKPTDRGGGTGIDSASIAYNFAQVVSKVSSITAKTHSDSLSEEYLPGREISVAILKNSKSTDYFVMPIERIVPPNEDGVRLLSIEMKHADAGLSVTVDDMELRDSVSALALNVFHALGARDLGRIDTRLDSHGVPHFLEANLIPSLVDGYGNSPKSCKLNINLDHEQMNNLRTYADQLVLAQPGQLPKNDTTGSVAECIKAFNEALQDDLNTSAALAAISLIESKTYSQEALQALEMINEVLGLQLINTSPLSNEANSLLAEYQVARDQKEYVKSDSLREQLKSQFALAVTATSTGVLVNRICS